MPPTILEKCLGIFASSGNELWVNGKKIYSRTFDVPSSLWPLLTKFVRTSKYVDRRGRHIELRPGMINFSTVGRNASLDDRRKYRDWDLKSGERKKMAEQICAHHRDIQVAIGGEISIDIYPTGHDKSQAVAYIREHHREIPINFFGDKTEKGGNDYSAASALRDIDTTFSVIDYKVTEKIINAFLEVKNND